MNKRQRKRKCVFKVERWCKGSDKLLHRMVVRYYNNNYDSMMVALIIYSIQKADTDISNKYQSLLSSNKRLAKKFTKHINLRDYVINKIAEITWTRCFGDADFNDGNKEVLECTDTDE